MPKSQVDTKEVVRLYVEEEWSVREIAQYFGSSYGRIYNRLRNRVVMRRSGDRGPRGTSDHVEIPEAMRQCIINGDWPPKRKILSQPELARIFRVRHAVIREAVSHLEQQGYLKVLPSKGTYVRPEQYWNEQEEMQVSKGRNDGVPQATNGDGSFKLD
jgi:DNA-binding transcriptional regulator YhcF (GntR family)